MCSAVPHDTLSISVLALAFSNAPHFQNSSYCSCAMATPRPAPSFVSIHFCGLGLSPSTLLPTMPHLALFETRTPLKSDISEDY